MVEQANIEDIENSVMLELSDENEDIDLESAVKIPYVMKDKILMSPGVWNSYFYGADTIKEAFDVTDWESKENRSLFLDHNDDRSSEWIGEVRNVRTNGDDIVGDLIILDKPTAMKLEYGAKMGISPKVHGPAEGNTMQRFVFDNFSVVINPAVKTAWINNSENFDLESIGDFIDVYKSFLEAEEVIEKMSKYTDFVKKYIKAHPDIPVAEAMKGAAKEWKKEGGKKMAEEEVQEEPQEEPKEEPVEAKMEEAEEPKEEPKEEPNELSDIKIMLEHILEEMQKKKKYPYPEKEKKMEDEEEELAKKKPKEEEEEEEEEKPKEEKKKMAKKKKPEEEEEKKMDEEVEEEPKEDVVKEMSDKIQKLEDEVQKLNKPSKVSVKQELSSENADNDMMNFLQTLS